MNAHEIQARLCDAIDALRVASELAMTPEERQEMATASAATIRAYRLTQKRTEKQTAAPETMR